MLDAARLVSDPSYRRRMFTDDLQPPGGTCQQQQDRPLVLQLSGNDPAVLAKACALAAEDGRIDAIDLNLGCPQQAASDGMYGAFLHDRVHWPLVDAIVRAMCAATSLPICCKIRLQPVLSYSIAFAKLLEQAGCKLLAVHGRQRGRPEQRQRRKGPADLEAIAAIKQAVFCPVLSNGNVRERRDLLVNLQSTGADGLMVGEALLNDPTLFASPQPSALGSGQNAACAGDTKHAGNGFRARVFSRVCEYLDLAELYPPSQGFEVVQQHVQHMLGKHGRGTTLRYRYVTLDKDPRQLRDEIAATSTARELRRVAEAALGLPPDPDRDQ
jgi:tRNA-dihydrouridine synthase 1